MIKTIDDLKNACQDYTDAAAKVGKRIVVCAGTGCVANGSIEVRDALVKEIQAKGINAMVEFKPCEDGTVHVSGSGCQGFCQVGPLVTVYPEGFFYTHVKADDAAEIVAETVINSRPVERLLYIDSATGMKKETTNDINFYARQNRLILGECGQIDPEDIGEYFATGGYQAACKTYTEMTPKEVCDEVQKSGLRGRGGGGFLTGLKWNLTLVEKNQKKYVICNGDEGDPGAFMDRSLMEGNPHRVLEGCMIAARAIEADEIYIYVRAEYPLAVKRVRKAAIDAEACGIFGDDIFGTGKSIKCTVMEGAGAFVCGEETALIASIEGERGMPRPKPPFPAQKGLWGKPTVINNVETLASIPYIITNGAEVFRSVGTETSPGTKTFALTGHVANAGLIEVPFGTKLREIVFDIGGGITDDTGSIMEDGFKAVQVGGPSGGCLTKDHLDLPLDFDSLQSIGAMVGSGGLVVMNKNTCMIKIAHFFMQFAQNESCGKCVPCREGTRQMLMLLEDIIEGNADVNTIEKLEVLARSVKFGSLCGLGKTAPNPVLTSLELFRDEYDAHVIDGCCPAGQCKALAKPEIIAELCKGCSACARKCPVDAISGEIKKPYVLDADKCIKCGTCADVCKFNAIVGVK